MPRKDSFADLLTRIRAGEEQAAEALARQYEPIIRREVRMRLTDPDLMRVLDSLDISQSVLLSFFTRAAAGEYELDRPRDLRNLLVTMARNKVVSQARKQRRAEPGGHRIDLDDLRDSPAVQDKRPTPFRVMANRDHLQEVQRRLPEEERRLADLRAQGQPWPAIAAAVGGTAEGRRKQLARALERVLRELGLESV